MAERKEDFFKSQIGTQAAVMNAWMLWKRESAWSADDVQVALPQIPMDAIVGHLTRLAGDHESRGGFLIRDKPGLFRVNPDKSPLR